MHHWFKRSWWALWSACLTFLPKTLSCFRPCRGCDAGLTRYKLKYLDWSGPLPCGLLTLSPCFLGYPATLRLGVGLGFLTGIHQLSPPNNPVWLTPFPFPLPSWIAKVIYCIQANCARLSLVVLACIVPSGLFVNKMLLHAWIFHALCEHRAQWCHTSRRSHADVNQRLTHTQHRTQSDSQLPCFLKHWLREEPTMQNSSVGFHAKIWGAYNYFPD